MKDLVSIIMPVYNNEKYLKEAIESVLNQTHNNIELLILDDGSSDKSLSIIEEYALENKNIRIISRGNKGVANSIRELLEYANGEYIARMDGDDVSYPNRIETQIKYLKDNNLSLVGTYVDVEITDYKNEDDKLFCEKIFNFKLDKNHQCLKILNGHRICHGTFLGKTSLFQKINYNVSLKTSEDLDFIFELIKQNYKVGIIDKKLYLNRINSNFVHEQKCLDEKYNQEILLSKIKFLEDRIFNREILIIGKNKYGNQLFEILNRNSKFKVKEICESVDNLKNEYVFITDRYNSENIEHKLTTLGKKNLQDFIAL